MNKCARGPAPGPLQEQGDEIGRDYAQQRHADPSYSYRWPERLYDVARAALHEMTGEHCSYCDGSPMDSVGEAQIDHFRPRSLPQFYELVCTWSNLFLTCVACNKAKRDAWNELLLRPDADDYRFERYFQYRSLTGELEPNGAASPGDQACAAKTIELLKLNRPGACTNRKLAVHLYTTLPADERSAVGYRFLIPLCIR